MSGLEVPGLVVTIGEATALGAKSAQKLHEVKHKVEKYSAQAQRLRQQIEGSTRLPSQVQVQLGRRAGCGSDAQLVRDIHAAVQACGTVLAEIEETADLALTKPPDQSYWQRVKYVLFNDDQVKDYLRELSHCLVTLLGFLCLLSSSPVGERTSHVCQLLESVQDASRVDMYGRNLCEIQISGTSEETPAETQNEFIRDFSKDPQKIRKRHEEPEMVPGHQAQTCAPLPSSSRITATDYGLSGESFTMLLGRKKVWITSGWEFIQAHVADRTILAFIDDAMDLHLQLTNLDIHALRSIEAKLEEVNAELYALNCTSDMNKRHRFLRLKNINLDFVAHPRGVSGRALCAQLKGRVEGARTRGHWSARQSCGPQAMRRIYAPSYGRLPNCYIICKPKGVVSQGLLANAADRSYTHYEVCKAFEIIQVFVERWLIEDTQLAKIGLTGADELRQLSKGLVPGLWKDLDPAIVSGPQYKDWDKAEGYVIWDSRDRRLKDVGDDERVQIVSQRSEPRGKKRAGEHLTNPDGGIPRK